MVTIDKYEFNQLNYRRYIQPDNISFLPYGHRDLKFIEDFKDSISFTPEKLLKYHENNLLRLEHGILESNERMRIVNCVLLQQPVFYKRSTLKRSQFQIESNTRNFLLHGLWRKIQKNKLLRRKNFTKRSGIRKYSKWKSDPC